MNSNEELLKIAGNLNTNFQLCNLAMIARFVSLQRVVVKAQLWLFCMPELIVGVDIIVASYFIEL